MKWLEVVKENILTAEESESESESISEKNEDYIK